jgi:hypothetical protein
MTLADATVGNHSRPICSEAIMKYLVPVRRIIAVVPLLGVGVLVADCRTATAQSFLDRIGQQVEREIRRAAEPSRKPSGGDSQVVPLDSLPNESGNKNTQGTFGSPNESGKNNNNNTRFNPGGFFNPRTTQPRTTQPYPQQTYPQNNRQATPPPARASDVSGLELKILSPRSMPGNVSYWLQTGNSQFDYTISPGHSQTLVDSRVWLIRFRQSGREIVYRLRGGKVYEFDMDASGRVHLYQIDQQPVDIAPDPPRPPGNRGR